MRLTLIAGAISLAFGLSAAAYADGSATVNQTGADNYGTIEQVGSGGVAALIEQIGDRNSVGAPASGALPAVQGVLQSNEHSSGVTVIQHGNDNSGDVVQQDGSSNTIRLWQGPNVVSNRNYGTVQQYGATGSFGEVFQDRATDNAAYVFQSGNANDARAVQGNFRWDGFGVGFTATNTSARNGFEYIAQGGDHMRGVADQLGNGNSAWLQQYGAWNDAGIMQDGSDNYANVYQYGTGASAADRNVALVSQTGSGFSANINQSGMRNFASVLQH